MTGRTELHCSHVARIPTADEVRAGRIPYCLNTPTVVESHTDDGCPDDPGARPELLLSWSCGGPHRFADAPETSGPAGTVNTDTPHQEKR